MKCLFKQARLFFIWWYKSKVPNCNRDLKIHDKLKIATASNIFSVRNFYICYQVCNQPTTLHWACTLKRRVEELISDRIKFSGYWKDASVGWCIFFNGPLVSDVLNQTVKNACWWNCRTNLIYNLWFWWSMKRFWKNFIFSSFQKIKPFKSSFLSLKEAVLSISSEICITTT